MHGWDSPWSSRNQGLAFTAMAPLFSVIKGALLAHGIPQGDGSTLGGVAAWTAWSQIAMTSEAGEIFCCIRRALHARLSALCGYYRDAIRILLYSSVTRVRHSRLLVDGILILATMQPTSCSIMLWIAVCQ